MKFNFYCLLIWIFLCNFLNFSFRVVISLILSVFNTFQVKLRFYYDRVSIRISFRIFSLVNQVFWSPKSGLHKLANEFCLVLGFAKGFFVALGIFQYIYCLQPSRSRQISSLFSKIIQKSCSLLFFGEFQFFSLWIQGLSS